MKIIKTVFFTICLIVFNVCNIVAQGGGTLPPPDDPEDPDIVPIDDYIILLIAVGVVLGIMIVYKNKIKKASI